jgi:hypothetical protein
MKSISLRVALALMSIAALVVASGAPFDPGP